MEDEKILALTTLSTCAGLLLCLVLWYLAFFIIWVEIDLRTFFFLMIQKSISSWREILCESSTGCYPQAHITSSKRNSKNIKHTQLMKILDYNVTHLLGENITWNFSKRRIESILSFVTVHIRSFCCFLDYYKMAPVLSLLTKGNISFLLD